MDIFDNHYYRINKYLMVFTGLWPHQPLVQRVIVVSLIYFIILTVILVQALKLVQLWGNISMMVECLVPMGVQTIAILKSSNCIANIVKMKRVMDHMRIDWASTTDRDEVRILLSYAKNGRLLGLSYIAAIMGSVIIYQVIPVMPQILDILVPLNESRPRQFMYQIEYYIDHEEHYTFIMVHTYLGTTITVIIIVTVDSMLIAQTHHVCGMFTIVGNRLKNTMNYFGTDASNDYDKRQHANIYGHIVNCIKKHGEVVEFARLIEKSISITLLFQIALNMIMVSATGLQIVTNLGVDNDEVFRLVQFIIGQLFHLFVNSWPSQMLIDHSEQFRDSIYFAEWYDFPLEGRHLIRLVLLRSLEPCKISAGKIYEMSMESFGKVVQTSLSYFTVLVSLR